MIIGQRMSEIRELCPRCCAVRVCNVERTCGGYLTVCGTCGKCFDFDPDDEDDGSDTANCSLCHGAGDIPTADYESYFGAMMKPCPQCFGKTEGLGHGRLS